MTVNDVETFLQEVAGHWPDVAEQWRREGYARVLCDALQYVKPEIATRGLGRWALRHNRPPTIDQLVETIEDVAQEERMRVSRHFEHSLPTPEQVASHSPPHRAAEDRAIANEALAMINGLLNNRLTMAQCVDRCHKLALEAATPELGQYWANYAERLQR